MHANKKIATALSVFALAILGCFSIVAQIRPPQSAGSYMVANIPIQATLDAKQKGVALKGNISLKFSASQADLKAGSVRVDQLNVVFFGVNQAAISGKDSKTKNGVLGMVVPPTADRPRLRYDPRTQTLSGDIPVQVHFSQLDEIFPPELIKQDREGDFAVSRTLRGKIQVQFKFTESLDRAATQAESGRQSARLNARASADVSVEPLQDNRFIVDAFRLRISELPALMEIASWIRFEAASRLCIQPVRIRSGASDPTPTGAGLAFGLPGATTQWNKADVTFQVRDWMTVTNGSLKVATEGAEETSIRASVNVDDCIEVFFVENFSPESLHGGGATWSSGTANAKIISSDGNAVGGIDLTHLAHELGHVLFMGHPGAPNGLFDASRNTLMCPSGWRNDNPKRNSQDNKDHVANPLLTFSLKVRTVGPDCTNNADCGSCP